MEKSIEEESLAGYNCAELVAKSIINSMNPRVRTTNDTWNKGIKNHKGLNIDYKNTREPLIRHINFAKYSDLVGLVASVYEFDELAIRQQIIKLNSKLLKETYNESHDLGSLRSVFQAIKNEFKQNNIYNYDKQPDKTNWSKTKYKSDGIGLY